MHVCSLSLSLQNLPILFVSAMTTTLLRNKREMFGANGPYECPCYKCVLLLLCGSARLHVC